MVIEEKHGVWVGKPVAVTPLASQGKHRAACETDRAEGQPEDTPLASPNPLLFLGCRQTLDLSRRKGQRYTSALWHNSGGKYLDPL